jgi:hypothetical protein
VSCGRGAGLRLAVAQESSKSAPLARELVALLDSAKRDHTRGEGPRQEDECVAAM